MTIGFDAKRAFYNKTGLGSYSRTVLNVLKQFYPENNYVLFAPKRNREKVKELDKEFYTVWSNSLLPGFVARSYGFTKTKEYNSLDLYHGLSGEIPMGKSRIPRIVTIHDLIFLKFPELYNPLDSKIYNFKSHFAVNNSQIVISISHSTKQDILTYYNTNPDKIRVVYQSYNPVFNKKVPATERKKILDKYNLPANYILYVGTIERRKNLLTLLKAADYLKIDIPIIVVGRFKSDYKKTILDFLSAAKIKKNIHFVHDVEFADLPAIYQSAIVFVYPSVYEGFGIPVIEAQQSGVPVITSNTSSLPEAAGPHSILINPEDYEQLAEGLAKLLNNENLRQEMIKAGFEYVKKFSPENFANSLMQVYKEAVGK